MHPIGNKKVGTGVAHEAYLSLPLPLSYRYRYRYVCKPIVANGVVWLNGEWGLLRCFANCWASRHMHLRWTLPNLCNCTPSSSSSCTTHFLNFFHPKSLLWRSTQFNQIFIKNKQILASWSWRGVPFYSNPLMWAWRGTHPEGTTWLEEDISAHTLM